MISTYRAMIRVFGNSQDVESVKRAMLHKETQAPGDLFSIAPLKFHGAPHPVEGFEARGEDNRYLPGFADVVLVTLSTDNPSVTFERIVDTQQGQTYEVVQAGQVLYSGNRLETTGAVYELGDPGLTFSYSNEAGNRGAFLQELNNTGANHSLQAI